MESLLDTKLLGRPGAYDGNRSDWHGWKFVMKSYFGAMNEELLSLLNGAEDETRPISLERMSADKQKMARTVAYVLSQTLKGSCLQLLMNTESLNGFEAWRQLVKREEPSEGSAQVAQLTAILKFAFTGRLDKFDEELQSFQGMVKRYETLYSEVLPDSIHQALLKSNAPAEIKTQVELTTFLDANELANTLVSFTKARMVSAGPTLAAQSSKASSPAGASDPNAMQVDYIGKGPKGKGGKKRQRKDERFQGQRRQGDAEGQIESEVRGLLQLLWPMGTQEDWMLVCWRRWTRGIEGFG